MDLTGRRAMVIGADNPAGGVIARAYAQAGADVALCALTPDEAVMRARAVRRAVEALGRRAPEYIMDVTLGKNVQVTTRQIVKDLGGLDVVVVAPDAFLGESIQKTTDTDLARVMQVNFNAHFFAIRAAADEFRRREGGGRIVCMTSVLGQRGAPNTAAFASAHGAVQALVRASSRELAPQGVAVNAIALGWMDWMDERFRADATALPDAVSAGDAEPAAASGPPSGRGRAEDVGPLALFLASEAASRNITGQVIPVDGGLLQHL
ncbi:MAG: SDR family oxidoreductase [Dehalococcoidia bacterium]|nr:SDR family oxidoreductase [Dehalococcoidia bacterium]